MKAHCLSGNLRLGCTCQSSVVKVTLRAWHHKTVWVLCLPLIKLHSQAKLNSTTFWKANVRSHFVPNDAPIRRLGDSPHELCQRKQRR